MRGGWPTLLTRIYPGPKYPSGLSAHILPLSIKVYFPTFALIFFNAQGAADMMKPFVQFLNTSIYNARVNGKEGMRLSTMRLAKECTSYRPSYPWQSCGI